VDDARDTFLFGRRQIVELRKPPGLERTGGVFLAIQQGRRLVDDDGVPKLERFPASRQRQASVGNDDDDMGF